MSYYTKVSLLSPPAKSVDLTGSLDAVKAVLDKLGVSHDVIEDFTALFASGKASLKVYPSHVNSLMVAVSKQQPEVRFVVRAQGEDEDPWAYSYLAGARTVAKATAQLSKEARAAVAALKADAPAKAYSPQQRFALGDVIEHSALGKGVVTQIHETKIVVQFLDAERTLVHARAG